MKNGRLAKGISLLLCAALLSMNMPATVYATGDGEDKDTVTAGPAVTGSATVEPVMPEYIEEQPQSVEEAGAASSWEDLVPQTPLEGNILVGISGAYYTETAETILNRINEIRLEACKEGVKDPYTGKALTEADYKPLQWSSDLEAIARLRAAEATVLNDHIRPNGWDCFSVKTTNNQQSWGENLAWNGNNLMYGIEQWYEEKPYWVNNDTTEVTGHYESLISTRYNYVAIGCFRQPDGRWYAIAQEFSDEENLDTTKFDSSGECVQDIEVPPEHLTELTIGDSDSVYVQEGATTELVLNANVSYPDYYGSAAYFTGAVSAGATWTSSDTSVATVDENGTVTALKTGTTTIQAAVESIKDTITLTVYAEGESQITIQAPIKTTYKVGEALSLTGGSITNLQTGETTDLTADMISGFTSDAAGICAVSVSYEGFTGSFDTLIVEEPKLTGQYGKPLSQIEIPANDYGTYAWELPNVLIEEVGVQKFEISYTPNDLQKFQKLTDLEAEVEAFCALETNAELILAEREFVYNGIEQEPAAIVKVGEMELIQGEDYTIAYANNKDAGTATVTVTGQNYYQGSKAVGFTIVQAELTIKAKDVQILIGEALPAFGYEVTGLASGESLVTEPTYACNVTDLTRAGEYEIIPGGASASANYDPNIIYQSGKLTISEEGVGYTVTFDMQGHGTAVERYMDVKAGDTILKPVDPVAEGYVFEGWYKDAACTLAWDFDKDIVQSDITLYAKWLIQKEESTVSIKEIADVYYTGKACKPTVQVYDEGTLLKANKDYKITYYNNIAVNQKLKTGDGAGANFDKALPYAQIVGKGNYSDTLIQVNFNILPVVIGDGTSVAGKGITVKYNQQLVANTKKALNPFVSIKGPKAMKKDVDYTLKLSTLNAYDESGRQVNVGTVLEGAQVPSGYAGSFRLDIKGMGNYTGSISTEIFVSDKNHLMKNAKIIIGKNLKKLTYTGDNISLVPGYYDSETKKYYAVENGKVTEKEVSADNVFTVRFGATSLIYQKDYTISYRNNIGVGKATMTITGKGKYVGSKSVTFQIAGAAFSAKYVQIEGLENKTYTGSAWLQNNVKLTYNNNVDAPETLVYGKHYTISYKNNIQKGTATMTFIALADSGYQGKFSKTFKILAADISKMGQSGSMKNISVEYERAGVNPYAYILLFQPTGKALIYNKDYTVSYRDNKVVAKATDTKHPTMIIKGKGNYTGSMEVPFTITQGDLASDRISIVSAFVQYNPTKAADAVYKPAVTVTDGKKRLSAGKDYAIEYVNNTQEKCMLYLEKYKQGTATDSDMPKAVITAVEGSCYKLAAPIEIPLSVYETKLNSKNLHVVVGETTYTGKQVKPAVAVYYHEDSKIVAQATGLTDERAILALGLRKLEQNSDYTLSYGKNVAAGKNKGSVKIIGASPLYGGSATVKFTIKGKKIVW